MTCPKSAKWNFFDLPKASEMTYSESESDFNIGINSASDFDSTSESGSESDTESDFNSVFMNLGVCIFFHPIFALF